MKIVVVWLLILSMLRVFAGNASAQASDLPISRIGDMVVPTREVMELKALIENAAVGQNSCTYMTEFWAFNFGCMSDGNPLGYYYAVIYRYGQPMTMWSTIWRTNYRGSGIACPLYEAPQSP
jgi:hypothetical protein